MIIRCAPPPLLAELYTRLFKGQLSKRARHPTANFVVQALMAAASSGNQVKKTEKLWVGPRVCLFRTPGVMWMGHLSMLSHPPPGWATWTGGVYGC